MRTAYYSKGTCSAAFPDDAIVGSCWRMESPHRSRLEPAVRLADGTVYHLRSQSYGAATMSFATPATAEESLTFSDDTHGWVSVTSGLMFGVHGGGAKVRLGPDSVGVVTDPRILKMILD